MNKQNMDHLNLITGILNNDLKVILEKEAMYKGSWKARGGIGAFFITARKWDALENMLSGRFGYDIFKACIDGGEGDGTPMEQVRDLRRYLTLIESEVINSIAPKKIIELNLKDVGAYGVGAEPGNTEHLNDRTHLGPKTI